MGEHHVRNVGVEGSIPFSSTTLPFLTTNMHQGIEPAAKGAPAYGATGVEQIGGKLVVQHEISP